MPELRWGYPAEVVEELAEIAGGFDAARDVLDVLKEAGLLKPHRKAAPQAPTQTDRT